MQIDRGIKKRLIESYGAVLPPLSKEALVKAAKVPDTPLYPGKMTYNELAWAVEFEELGRSIERKASKRDVEMAIRSLGSESPAELLEEIVLEMDVILRGNPQRVEAQRKLQKKRKKTERTVRKNLYDASDYWEVSGKVERTAKDILYDNSMNPADPRYDRRTFYFPYESDAVEVGGVRAKAGLNPDQGAVTVSPVENLDEALIEAQERGLCSLDCLINEAELSKEASADLARRTQPMTYEATVYTFHGRPYASPIFSYRGRSHLNLNYVLSGPDGRLWVQDQHDRLATLALYLKRETSDSYTTHAEIHRPAAEAQFWTFQAKPASEGVAVLFTGKVPRGCKTEDHVSSLNKKYRTLGNHNQGYHAFTLKTCREKRAAQQHARIQNTV